VNTIFGVLLAAGAVITMLLVLLNTVARAPRRRKKMPSDPGFPQKPLGAPYRGPY